MNYDEWKLQSPYDLVKPYSVLCRVCEEYVEPDDAALEESDDHSDGFVFGVCDACAAKVAAE